MRNEEISEMRRKKEIGREGLIYCDILYIR